MTGASNKLVPKGGPQLVAWPDLKLAQAGQGEGQGVLGHGLGKGPFGARPGHAGSPGVPEHTRLRQPLDPGHGQLHPAHLGVGLDHLEEALGGRTSPDHAFGPLARTHHPATASLDRSGGPWRGARPNQDGEHGQGLRSGNVPVLPGP